MKKTTRYMYETLRMDKGITIGIAKRKKVDRYGTSYNAARTYQRHIHIGKVSIYISRRKTCAKQGIKEMGGHADIGIGELHDKLLAFGVTSGMIAACFADSF